MLLQVFFLCANSSGVQIKESQYISLYLSFHLFRNPCEPHPHHGEAGVGPVQAL